MKELVKLLRVLTDAHFFVNFKILISRIRTLIYFYFPRLKFSLKNVIRVTNEIQTFTHLKMPWPAKLQSTKLPEISDISDSDLSDEEAIGKVEQSQIKILKKKTRDKSLKFRC